MKQYLSLALVIVLTAVLFTGCGCTGKDAEYTTAPNTMPTIMTTVPTTEASRATTESTTESTTQSTADRGNGPLEDTATTSTETTGSTAEGRSRRMNPAMN